MRLIPCLNRDDLSGMGLEIIVRRWRKRSSSRSNRERWFAEFTESERRELTTIYPKLYTWVLVRGFPGEVAMDLKTMDLLLKARNFFGGL